MANKTTTKKNTAKSIIKMISDKDIAFVDFRFTDPRGKWQHTAQTVSYLDEDVLNEIIPPVLLEAEISEVAILISKATKSPSEAPKLI